MCNFYYGKESRLLVNSNKAIPLNGNKNISFDQASQHPKWKMGYKNSIDSATLVNKCLEVVEAHYLFNIPFNNLEL